MEKTIKSTRHSRYQTYYHIVWIPKHRKPVLTGAVADKAREVLLETARGYGWEIVALEVMPDHIRLFVSAPPQFAPSHLAKVFKGVAGRKILKAFPGLAKKTGRGTLWAPSYYVGTAGHVSAETVRRYIEECQST